MVLWKMTSVSLYSLFPLFIFFLESNRSKLKREVSCLICIIKSMQREK